MAKSRSDGTRAEILADRDNALEETFLAFKEVIRLEGIVAGLKQELILAKHDHYMTIQMHQRSQLLVPK